MTIGLTEYVRVSRYYEYDITEQDLGELNVYLLMNAIDTVEPIEMSDIRDIYNCYEPLGEVQLRGRKYKTDLNDFVREWFDDIVWDNFSYEGDYDTDDVERWARD